MTWMLRQECKQNLFTVNAVNMLMFNPGRVDCFLIRDKHPYMM